MDRITTGNPGFDECLGGGLLPGTLTVVLGATGIGKTQFGIQFANQGLDQEGERGIIFDMTSRGDSQNHSDYAERICEWQLRDHIKLDDIEQVWESQRARHDYLHIFQQSGRRVTINDLEPDAWREWKAELARKLDETIAFFYGNFIHGVRRCVIDGIEPTDRVSDSIQFELFEYVYHQILQKECDWVARDLFRVRFRRNAEKVAAHAYRHDSLATVLLVTTHEVMLDALLARPLTSGDVLSNANTIILMGKVRTGDRMGRAFHVAKHRGSACDDSIIPFEVTTDGLRRLRAE